MQRCIGSHHLQPHLPALYFQTNLNTRGVYEPDTMSSGGTDACGRADSIRRTCCNTVSIRRADARSCTGPRTDEQTGSIRTTSTGGSTSTGRCSCARPSRRTGAGCDSDRFIESHASSRSGTNPCGSTSNGNQAVTDSSGSTGSSSSTDSR
jgi:hypothetical protein